MNILLITNHIKTAKVYETVFTPHRFKMDSIVLDRQQDVSTLLKAYIGVSLRAIIIDRVDIDLTLIRKYFREADVFFILEKWSDISQQGNDNINVTFRFYLSPVNYAVLVDDIKSICLSKAYLQTGTIELGNVCLDLNAHTISDGEVKISLKKKEFDLLVYLARHKGKVISRVSILENVWDMNSQIITNTVDVHISKIRRILRENFGITNLIKTIPCCGYQLV